MVVLVFTPVVVIVNGAPLIVYINVKGAVPTIPVNVIIGEGSFWQTLVVPAIIPVGKGLTVTIEVAGKLTQFGAASSVI